MIFEKMTIFDKTECLNSHITNSKWFNLAKKWPIITQKRFIRAKMVYLGSKISYLRRNGVILVHFLRDF